MNKNVSMNEEGTKLSEKLLMLGIDATCVKSAASPQLYKFDFELKTPTTINAIKKAVEKLHVYYGGYEYANTETGKGFAVIRPLPQPRAVFLNELKDSTITAINMDENGKQKCYINFGIDSNGNNVIRNINTYRNILVAGSAGSGKSCFLNSLIIQLLVYSNANLCLIDPKGGAEFGVYETEAHNRVIQVAKSVETSIECLQKAVMLMEDRYKEMSKTYAKTYTGIRRIIVIDELADLMMASNGEVESLIVRLAQKGRAAGIHLIIATQDPRVQVVTGLIKYNMNTLVCLKTMNKRHSINIIDKGDGANLMGRGDAYIKFEDTAELIRVQTPYISDKAIINIITH